MDISLTVTRQELKDIIASLDFTANDVSEKVNDLLNLKAKLEEQAGWDSEEWHQKD